VIFETLMRTNKHEVTFVCCEDHSSGAVSASHLKEWVLHPRHPSGSPP